MTYDVEVSPEFIRCFPGLEGFQVDRQWLDAEHWVQGGPVMFGTVQAALDAATGREHTTILLRKGTYVENCEVNGGKVELWGE